MNKFLVVAALALFCSGPIWAQKLSKPKRMPASVTAEQEKAIRDGIALHDAKKYDEAIAKYASVLLVNPDSTVTLYEMALSYYNKGDCAKTKETAVRGSNYIADELPLFYGLLAHCLDDEGKSDDAIKLYREAEDILKSFPELRKHLASIYYNLGVTYFRQKKYAEVRAELKNAVENDFAYASPHLLLGIVFEGTKYKVPALLSALRFVSLEHNTQRTKRSVAIITNIMKPASKDPKSGNINIFLNLDAPKDEGDFGMFDLLLGTLTAVRGEDDKDKTDNQMFVEGLGTVIGILSEDKKMRSTFVGKHYVPFLTEMKKAGHLETLGNLVLYVNDENNAEAAKWVKANNTKVGALLTWAKEYRLPAK